MFTSIFISALLHNNIFYLKLLKENANKLFII